MYGHTIVVCDFSRCLEDEKFFTTEETPLIFKKSVPLLGFLSFAYRPSRSSFIAKQHPLSLNTNKAIGMYSPDYGEAFHCDPDRAALPSPIKVSSSFLLDCWLIIFINVNNPPIAIVPFPRLLPWFLPGYHFITVSVFNLYLPPLNIIILIEDGDMVFWFGVVSKLLFSAIWRCHHNTLGMVSYT